MLHFRSAGAAVAGAVHAYHICQDAVNAYEKNDGCSVTLCDGAGSCRFAAQAAQFQSSVIGNDLLTNFEKLFNLEYSDMAAFLKELLRRQLFQYSQEHDFDYRDLSATAIAVAAKQDGRFIALHVGDGALFAVDQTNVILFSGPENEENDTSVTSFINCLLDESSFRLYKGRKTEPFVFLLTSDGLSSFFLESRAVVKKIAVQALQGDCQQQITDTVSLLARSGVTFDDCSLGVLAFRPKQYPACLKELPPAQARLLRLLARGIQPAQIKGHKTRGRIYKTFRILRKAGYIGQDPTNGKFYLFT